MTDDRTAPALHRLSLRPDRARPLSADARARIEARLDAAFTDASTATDLGARGRFDIVDAVPDRAEPSNSDRRRKWLAPLTAAAAAVVVVLGFAMVRTEEPPPTATVPGLSPSEFPTDLLRPGTRWMLATRPTESGAGRNSAALTIRIDDQANAQARVQTSDVPPLQFLGEVRFDVSATGHVLVPLVLLDPEREWVDCDATLDLGGSGTTGCDDDVVDYVAEAGADDAIVTPAGRYEARPFEVDWSDDTFDVIRTRLWISPRVGPVRIEIDDGDTTRTFILEELDTPDNSTTPTPSGD